MTIKETDFMYDLVNREKLNIHVLLLEKKLLAKNKKFHWSNDISKRADIVLTIDEVREEREKTFLIECKSDYRAFTTNNLAIELITQCEPNLLCGINQSIVRPYEKEKRLTIQNIIDGNYLDRKISVHLLENAKDILWSYIVVKGKTLAVLDDVARHFIFNGEDLSLFTKTHYKDYNWAITTSKRQNSEAKWCTVSTLFPIKLIEKIDKNR